MGIGLDRAVIISDSAVIILLNDIGKSAIVKGLHEIGIERYCVVVIRDCAVVIPFKTVCYSSIVEGPSRPTGLDHSRATFYYEIGVFQFQSRRQRFD
jgi:hypothetical protein